MANTGVSTGVGVVGSIIFAISCGYMAYLKGRGKWLWGILGFFFTLIILIIVMLLPRKTPRP
jgi:bacteriorhodopsin